MFKSLGNSFLDIFKKPLNILYLYIVFLVFTLVFDLIFEYTYDYLPEQNISFFGQILYIITNYFWLILIYLILYLFLFLIISLLISYIINKKLDIKERVLGTSKVFGFTLFLSIISIAPSIFFSIFDFNLLSSTIFFIISLLYIFLIFPYLFLVPILLVFNDLKTSLSESFKFAKNHYWWIIILQILFVILLTLLNKLFEFLAIYLSEVISEILFLLVMTILFLWVIYFAYNWYKSEN